MTSLHHRTLCIASPLLVSTLLVSTLLSALLLAGSVQAAETELSEAATWLRDYVRIDTTNPPGNEHQAAAYLARLLRREGIEFQLLVRPEGRTSLYARLRAREPKAGPLVLMHHMDVVPATAEEWQVDPFAGDVRDGALWGRGTVDTKGLGIAHLAAVIDLQRRGVELQRDIVFLAVADEENGGGRGTAWLLDHHGELFEGVDAVFNEGGSNRTVSGKVRWWGIEVAQKRPLWLRVTATGRTGHASGFNLHSANHQLIDALYGLLQRPLQFRVSPPVRTYFHALAPLQNATMAELYAHIDDHVGDSGLTAPVGSPNSFLDTIQITVLTAGDRINSIPSSAEARIDIRLLPDTDETAFLDDIRRHLGDRVNVEVLLGSPPAPASPTDSNVYRRIAQVFGEQAPVVPAFISGFTDSRYFRLRGIPAYGVWPFALELAELQGIHGFDERISLDRFDAGVELMVELVRACALEP